ncbi:MAG: Bifunctional transcriptional activator/DNA repair enzyme AdaA [Lentisphaerae bacterium ADurb.Bin242]|nr:MAG: Bifunctional transcriptional activator/DNA repair enzyme AdaA [Lentisphaerae bacterium ADurb.Bin242]
MNNTEKTYRIERCGKNLPARMREYGFWIYPSGYIAPRASKSTSPYEKCPKREFGFFTISHMHAGHGHLWLGDGREFEVHPGDCIVVTPGMPNRFGGINGKGYIEDTCDFGGPAAVMMQRAGIIQSGLFPLDRKVRRLVPIIEYTLDPSVESQFTAVFKLQQLLMRIYEDSLTEKKENPMLETITQHINAYPQKWWTVSELAEICRMSTTHLRRLFLRKTGLSPKAYIDAIKMNLASSRLLNTDTGIREIALSLGYRNQYHFSCRFKTITGLSPRSYRSKSKPSPIG